MLRDWGSWDAAFNQITASICRDLVDIVDGGDDYVCVPLQGSGTFSVERRSATWCHGWQGAGARQRRLLRAHREDLQLPEPRLRRPADRRRRRRRRPPSMRRWLPTGRSPTSRWCTARPAPACATPRRHRAGLPCSRQGTDRRCDEFVRRPAIDARSTAFDALVAASGKCLEGVPAWLRHRRRDALLAGAGNSHSLAMDLHDQYTYMQRTAQWRYTRRRMLWPRCARRSTSSSPEVASRRAGRATPPTARR